MSLFKRIYSKVDEWTDENRDLIIDSGRMSGRTCQESPQVLAHLLAEINFIFLQIATIFFSSFAVPRRAAAARPTMNEDSRREGTAAGSAPAASFYRLSWDRLFVM